MTSLLLIDCIFRPDSRVQIRIKNILNKDLINKQRVENS